MMKAIISPGTITKVNEKFSAVSANPHSVILYIVMVK